MDNETGFFGAILAVWLVCAALCIGFWGVVIWAIVNLVNHFT